VEHHDHAVVSGRLAGENMTGACGNAHLFHSLIKTAWSNFYEKIKNVQQRNTIMRLFLLLYFSQTFAGTDIRIIWLSRRGIIFFLRELRNDLVVYSQA
jgi:hypothetical protein